MTNEIAPKSKKNSVSLTLLGSVSLFLGLLLFLINSFFIMALILFATGAVCTILGLAKLRQPEVSFRLQNDGFCYFHHRGQLTISWENIQRLDVPKVTHSIGYLSLPYIGIKLRTISPMLDAISPRLATGLLTEQRSLLMTAGAQAEDKDALESYMNNEFMPLSIDNDRYRGVLAMFGRRCLMLSENLGYHIYIPTDSLDRDPEEFIRLLKELKHNHSSQIFEKV